MVVKYMRTLCKSSAPIPKPVRKPFAYIVSTHGQNLSQKALGKFR